MNNNRRKPYLFLALALLVVLLVVSAVGLAEKAKTRKCP